MSNYLKKRQFNSQKELVELINEYFDEEKFIMIETFYQYLGISKHNYRDWKGSKNPKLLKWAQTIDEAKQIIKTHLMRIIAYGQTEDELEHTKVTKSYGNGNESWEFNKANPAILKSYIKSRYKDDLDADIVEKADTSAQITINFSNEGGNKVE